LPEAKSIFTRLLHFALLSSYLMWSEHLVRFQPSEDRSVVIVKSLKSQEIIHFRASSFLFGLRRIISRLHFFWRIQPSAGHSFRYTRLLCGFWLLEVSHDFCFILQR
jgi:hypothetical protein